MIRPMPAQIGKTSIASSGRFRNRKTQPIIVAGPTSHSAGVRKVRGRSGSDLRNNITEMATIKKAYNVPALAISARCPTGRNAAASATTTPTRGTGTPLSQPNAVNATAVQSSGQSNDPYVQKRQKDAEAKAEYKERKAEAKREAKMEKRAAKAEMKQEKRESTAERNEALAPAAAVK